MDKEAKDQQESKTKTEQTLDRLKKMPFYIILTAVVGFIIVLGNLTGALADIPSNISKVVGYFHSPTTPTPTPVKLPPIGTEIYSHSAPKWGGLFAWSPDGKRIANTNTDGTIQLWDATTGQHPVTYLGFKGKNVTVLAWSHDSTRLAAAADGAINIWLADTGVTIFSGSVARILELGGEQTSNSRVNAIAWSPTADQIAFGDDNGDAATVNFGEAALHPYDIDVLERFQNSAQKYPNGVFALAWSPDGKYGI